MLLSFGRVQGMWWHLCRKAGISQRMLSEWHKAAPGQGHRLDKASVCLICSDLPWDDTRGQRDIQGALQARGGPGVGGTCRRQSEQPLSLKPPLLKPWTRQGGASKELVLLCCWEWSQEKAGGLWAAGEQGLQVRFHWESPGMDRGQRTGSDPRCRRESIITWASSPILHWQCATPTSACVPCILGREHSTNEIFKGI